MSNTSFLSPHPPRHGTVLEIRIRPTNSYTAACAGSNPADRSKKPCRATTEKRLQHQENDRKRSDFPRKHCSPHAKTRSQLAQKPAKRSGIQSFSTTEFHSDRVDKDEFEEVLRPIVKTSTWISCDFLWLLKLFWSLRPPIATTKFNESCPNTPKKSKFSAKKSDGKVTLANHFESEKLRIRMNSLRSRSARSRDFLRYIVDSTTDQIVD